MKKTHEGVLLLVTLLKVTLLHGSFSRFSNCTNGTKSRNAPQNKPQVFLLCLKRNDSQTFKTSSSRNLFSGVYAVVQLVSMIFFTPCDNWETLFFIKVFRYSEVFFESLCCCSLRKKFWKKSVFTLSTQRQYNNNSKVPK